MAQRTYRGHGIAGATAYARALREGGLPAAYAGLGKARRRYVHDLVKLLGWPCRLALQQAYVRPYYAPWLYDYRARGLINVTVNRRTGAITL